MKLAELLLQEVSSAITLTLLHSEWPELHRVLAILSAKGISLDWGTWLLMVILM